MLIDNANITQQQDCFSGMFSSYDVWQKEIKQRYQPQYHTQEQLSHAMSSFEARYPRHKFNDAQRELACSTITYSVGGIPVDGFVINPKFSIKPLPVVVFNRGATVILPGRLQRNDAQSFSHRARGVCDSWQPI
ncbi:hypothetical protein ACVBIL_01715 [Shewanella sp. 125m-7]